MTSLRSNHRLPSFPRLLGPDWGWLRWLPLAVCSADCQCLPSPPHARAWHELLHCYTYKWAAQVRTQQAATGPPLHQPRLSCSQWARAGGETGKLELLSRPLLVVYVRWESLNKSVCVRGESCLSQCEENLYCVGGSVRGSLKLNEVTKVIITSNLSNHSIVELRVLLWCDVEDCSKIYFII